MKEKYDSIGIGYNQTRTADPYLVERLFHHLNSSPNGQYLDIGSGTGNYTIALHQKGLAFTGVEPSDHMISIAKEKCKTIQWLSGKAENIPLPDRSMEGATASLTIHHWTDLANGFQELFRVLKPGATLVIFTATPQQMQGYWLNHYFPNILLKSMKQMPAQETVLQHLHESGFTNIQTEKYFIRPDLQDLFLYAGKDNPALYLNPQVRKGISSFSDLANEAEVNRGLARLETDILLGKVQTQINNYKNEDGDYLYIIAKKEVK